MRLIHLPVSADGQIRPLLLQRSKHFLIHIRVDPVVPVHEADIAALRNGDPSVSGLRRAAVFLMNDLHPAVFCGQTVTDNTCIIGRAVVHHDDFQIAVSLGTDRAHAPLNISGDIVSRHDHRDQILLRLFPYSGRPVVFQYFHLFLFPLRFL